MSGAAVRDVDVEQFPVGCRVATPTGRVGVVVKHRGYESKLDFFMRVTVRLGERDLVTLQPHLLTKCPPEDPTQKTIEA